MPRGSSEDTGLRLDVSPGGRRYTISVGPENLRRLRQALDDVEQGYVVTLGTDPCLIIRPKRAPGQKERNPDD